MKSRIEIFEQMLADDPGNTMVMFGLAKEYEKAGQFDKVIVVLKDYLAKTDDEGNAYGTLAAAYIKTGQRALAAETYRKGIEAATAHGHPSMAEDYKMTLELDFAE